jgi:hypothetical protein
MHVARSNVSDRTHSHAPVAMHPSPVEAFRAHHHQFLSSPAETERYMRAFLTTLPVRRESNEHVLAPFACRVRAIYFST